MKVKKWIIYHLCLFLMLSLFVCDVQASSYKVFWYNVKPTTMGEFNFSSVGRSGKVSAQLYKVGWFGIKSKVSLSRFYRNKNNFKLEASLLKNTKYSLKVSYIGKKPKISYGRNQDYYNQKNKKCSYSISWQPNSGTYQPFTKQGIETRQILYLTKEDAAVYCTKLSESKYLKYLDTKVKLTYIITKWGISPTSGLGKVLLNLGKNKFVVIAKEILSTYGGWKLIPKLSSHAMKMVKKASHDFKNGVKIIVTYTDRGGLTNTYEPWNEKFSSVKGKEYCRGKFMKSKKVKGWY